jgi:hypothetical protein
MFKKFLPFGVLAAVTAAPALAQDRPLLRPTRDVAVEYRSSGIGQGPGDIVTMRFTRDTRRIRIDGSAGHGYMILDTDAGRMTIVMAERQMYMDRPADPSMMGIFQARNGGFRKTGTDTVAGLSCTTYDATFNERNGQVCLTDDGVLLRAHSIDPGHDSTLEATKVTYGDQAASLFETPAGYQKFEIPKMPGGMPPGMGAPQMGPRGGVPGVPPPR